MYKTQNGPVFSVNKVKLKERDNAITSRGIEKIYKMSTIASATTQPLRLLNLVNSVDGGFLSLRRGQAGQRG